MSKASKESLFGVTLTELVIILFFIMLLLSIFNIDELREQVEELTELVPATEDDIVPASAVVELLIPNAEITSDLVPMDVIKDEIRKLQEDKKQLEEMKSLTEGDGDGDCREGGNWIQPKCNDFCWEIDEETNGRKFDYLIDIGVCNSSIVVQRSEWLEKNESNFLLVDGALELVDSNAISKEELYEFLEIIKEPGYVKEPKQCFHMARLVDLQNVSGDLLNRIGREIRERLGTSDYTASIAGFQKVRDRFPADICSNIIPQQRIKEAPKKISSSESDQPKNASKQTETAKSSKAKVNIVPATLVQSTYNENLLSDRRCNRINSSEFDARIKVQVDSRGDPVEVEVLDDEGSFSRSERKILDIAKDALMKSSFIAGTVEGITVNSDVTMMYNFPQNVCRSRY